MTVLPFWCDSEHGRAIIAAIIRRPPDSWKKKRFAWLDDRFPWYRGEDAKCLRRIWEVQVDAALRLEDGPLYHRLNEELPDDLIDRVLREQVLDDVA